MPKAKSARLGVKVRALRRREGLTQAQLAKRLEISSSYLNLIENDKRPLTAPLLIKLASAFAIDVSAFAAADDDRLVVELMEVFGDSVFDEVPLTNTDVQELAQAHPAVAGALLRLYREFRAARDGARALAARVADSDVGHASVPRQMLPSEEVSDFLQARGNHFAALEAVAEDLWREAGLSEDALQAGLRRHLEARGVTVEVARGAPAARSLRRYDPDRRRLTLSERLPPRSRNFQLAHQIALLDHRDVLDDIASSDALSTEDSRALCRVTLANYFAGAVLMPYASFLQAAKTERYDLELLGHRFRTSYEQVAHRLTAMSRPGAEGVPFHLIRVDVAGNISKRFSGSGIQFARYSGTCPRWNVFTAFATPGVIHVQVSEMSGGERYFCMARTVRTTIGGYNAPVAHYAIGLGCDIEHASKLVYADGLDVEGRINVVPVGVTCRLCERQDCPQRALPSLQAVMHIDENRRGLSFYAPGS